MPRHIFNEGPAKRRPGRSSRPWSEEIRIYTGSDGISNEELAYIQDRLSNCAHTLENYETSEGAQVSKGIYNYPLLQQEFSEPRLAYQWTRFTLKIHHKDNLATLAEAVVYSRSEDLAKQEGEALVEKFKWLLEEKAENEARHRKG